MTASPITPATTLSIGSILMARCPSCRKGAVLRGFSIRPACEACGYDFYPENGFYLGAMAVSFLLTAMLMIPSLVLLKLLGVELPLLFIIPAVELGLLMTFLLIYSRVVWLHVEHRMTGRLDGRRLRRG